MPIEISSKSNPLRTPWNKGRLVGQKRPLRPKEVWAIRVRLQINHNKRDLAMFNLAIDSKLRGCDLVSLRVDDIAVGGHVRDRATIIQRKTGRPVQFEITEQTGASLQDWLNARPVDRGPYVFPSRVLPRLSGGLTSKAPSLCSPLHARCFAAMLPLFACARVCLPP